MDITQLLTTNGLRADSRRSLEMRSVKFEVLSGTEKSLGADGEALVQHGLTTVRATVRGPMDPSVGGGSRRGGPSGPSGPSSEDRASVEVQFRGLRRRLNTEHALALRNTFAPVIMAHLYPRSAIRIDIDVIADEGAALQAAINATTVALMSAGVPLTDYVCGLSLGSYPQLPVPQPAPFDLVSGLPARSNDAYAATTGCTTLVDLTAAEEFAVPHVTVGVLPDVGKITLLDLESRIATARFEEMLRWGVEGAGVLHEEMQRVVGEWGERSKRERLSERPSEAKA